MAQAKEKPTETILHHSFAILTADCRCFFSLLCFSRQEKKDDENGSQRMKYLCELFCFCYFFIWFGWRIKRANKVMYPGYLVLSACMWGYVYVCVSVCFFLICFFFLFKYNNIIHAVLYLNYSIWIKLYAYSYSLIILFFTATSFVVTGGGRVLSSFFILFLL